MNILQTIWSALTTQSATLTNVLGIPLTFLDISVCMFYFSTILNIKTTRLQKILYILIYGVIANIATFTIPATYKIFFNIIAWPILIYLILKPGLIKSILSVIITLIVTSILESIIINIFLVFGIESQMLVQIPLYRIISYY